MDLQEFLCISMHMCMHACLLVKQAIKDRGGYCAFAILCMHFKLTLFTLTTICFSDYMLSDFVSYGWINISTHSKLFNASLPAHACVVPRLELFTFLFFWPFITYRLTSHAKLCLKSGCQILYKNFFFFFSKKLQNWGLGLWYLEFDTMLHGSLFV